MDFSFGSEIKDLYESDKAQLREVVILMYDRYKEGKLLTPLEDAARRGRFSREVQERSAELGFVADVLWTWESEERDPEDPDIPARYSPCCSADPDDPNIYWLPKMVITGRTAKLLDYDHDQQKFEVREGTFDGVKGVIDPNTGLLREDSKKKSIY